MQNCYIGLDTKKLNKKSGKSITPICYNIIHIISLVVLHIYTTRALKCKPSALIWSLGHWSHPLLVFTPPLLATPTVPMVHVQD